MAATLGAFAAALRWEALPAPVRTAGIRLLLDTVGVILAGAATAPGRRVAAVSPRRWPEDEATLLGVGSVCSLEGAAFGNATLAKIVGMEDSNRTCGHVASQVVPAALAAGEARGASGAEVVVAVIAGYEVFARVGREVRKAHLVRGLDIKGTVGTIASAAAAARAWRLDGIRTAHALGLAASLASGLETYAYDPEGDTEWLVAGFAARNGVFAARLAEAGFRAPRRALEGPGGFGQAFGEGFDAGRAVAALGEYFEVERAGFKPHSGCRHVHQAVDAAVEIRQHLAAAGGGQIDPASIEAVTVATYRHAVAAPFRTTTTPLSAGAAGYSLPVATAIGLLFGSFYPEDIARYQDPCVRALARKVRLAVDPEIEARHPEWNGCEVRVRLRGGREVAARLTHARGEPENPLSDQALAAKFRRLAGATLPSPQVEALLRRLWTLDAAENIRAVMPLTLPGPGPVSTAGEDPQTG
ncbi:MAG: MmgE/PrpD family protein [Armatimonadota bacterium]|nr:MmgE/PrpD family protein [Armatimonadota bacterium]MDR7491153.1 MmgE/PrpD family protein [Armatimonadota bacterium]MDR7528335.1 MmgE/PrpD family protein [Armatimonadota bacterium]MDR7543728.1 MmgE/PrpD family protein [Armatimonadota bacterium]MDR7573774.1 MmgE/PrpD family protein [Armatimonadota bacterium]